MLKQVVSKPDQIPLNNLPQWSRINNLDRSRYPKPFMKDRVLVLADPVGDIQHEEFIKANKTETLLQPDTFDLQKKLQLLENTVLFLKKQHREVLEALHEEVDCLKRQNHELQFQVALCQSSTVNSMGHDEAMTVQSSRDAKDNDKSNRDGDAFGDADRNNASDNNKGKKENQEKLEIIFKQEEIAELKNLLKEEKLKNYQLKEELAKYQTSLTHDDGNDEVPPSVSLKLVPHPPSKPRSSDQQHSRAKPATAAGLLPFSASTEPLQVHVTNHHQSPHPTTLQESEIIIKHLLQENGKKSQELKKMTSDLYEVLYTHKWSPDSYLLAKSYLPDDEGHELTGKFKENQGQSLKQSKKLPLAMVSLPKDGTLLPPLNQSINYRLVERRAPKLLPKRRIASEQQLSIHMTRDGVSGLH